MDYPILNSLSGANAKEIEQLIKNIVPIYYTNLVPQVPVDGVGGAGPLLSSLVKNATDLSEYLLIDTQITSAVTTTYVAEAISSLQYYINACLGGFEPAVNNSEGSTLVEQSRPGGFLYNWSDYNQTYSTWAGKERLQYYPSIYISPALRYKKTSLFEALEQTINQSRVSEQKVNAAFNQYLSDFENLAQLETISAYQTGATATKDSNNMIYFVGKSKNEPYQYYWRSCNMAIRDTDKMLTSGAWSQWSKIAAPLEQAHNAYVAPFWFQSRLYVCWISSEEITEQTAEKTYWVNIYYLDADVNWVSAQKIAINLSNPTLAWAAGSIADPAQLNIFVQAMDGANQRLYRYEGDSNWAIFGNQWAPAGFVFQPFTAALNNGAQALPGETFIVSGSVLCTVITAVPSPFKIQTSTSVLEYSLYNKNDVLITTSSANRGGDGIVSIPYTVDTAYITIKNAAPASLRLYVVNDYFLGFITNYFTGPQFVFNNGSLFYKATAGGNSNFMAQISTSSGPFFYKKLRDGGISGLLSYSNQTDKIETVYYRENNTPDHEEINFNSAYGLYFWEIFFYLPFLIADRYLTEQNYAQSAVWYQYIFSCDGYRNDNGELEMVDLPDNTNNEVRYWNVAPLQQDKEWNAAIPPTVDPDVIAMNDPMQFKMAVFIRTVDMLIEAGDNYYRQLQRDLLVQAKMYYTQAEQLLGQKPQVDKIKPKPWLNLPVGAEAQAMVIVNADNPNAPAPTAFTQAFRAYLDSLNGNFLPPYNADLLEYWDKLAIRFYNLRHDLSLHGQPLSIPVYATPVSPTELQLQQSAGNGPGGSNNKVLPLPTEFRFVVLADKARMAVSNLVQFGNELLSVLEKRDNEAMTLLLQRQQQAVAASTKQIQTSYLLVLQNTILASQKALLGAKNRFSHFQSLYDENVSTTERDAMNLQTAAGTFVVSAMAPLTAAAIIKTFPNIAGTSFGGGDKGAAISASVGTGLLATGQVMELSANRLNITESYRRRRDEWLIQRDNATHEIAQLEAQIASQEDQLVMAQQQVELTQLQVEQQDAIYKQQIGRFTGQDLYNWMVGRLSALYFQLYDQTLPLCLAAKSALGREINASKTQMLFTSPTWNDLYQGLLAGEGLLLELQRMENIYLRYDTRGLEIQKNISLNALVSAEDDQSFNQLINTALSVDNDGRPITVGPVIFKQEQRVDQSDITYDFNQLVVKLDIAALQLDAAYNLNDVVGRFKSISVTLPTLLGPYQNIEATLSLQGDGAAGIIALSRALDDSGLFVLDFNDPKYLPFENASTRGGTLVLTFYQTNREGAQRNTVEHLTDVIYQLSYTLKTA